MKRVFLLLFFLFICRNLSGQIVDYRLFFGEIVSSKNEKLIVLRKWKQDNQNFCLAVNPMSLRTEIINTTDRLLNPLTWQEIDNQYTHSAYWKAMRDEKKRDAHLQDAGITRTDSTERGFSLTIDLCPSQNPLVREIFTNVIAAFEKEEKPIPVTITITGKWIQNHAQDLAWLKELEKKGDLKITWVNHSFHHNFDLNLPLDKDFLLEAGTSIPEEVFENEKLMITNGLTPSIFFRFPGLISDKAIFDQILSYGLLPIGSDAWLAKMQKPKNGSLVLIHGTGHEPLGIKLFIKQIKQKSKDIQGKNWLLYDLGSSIAKSEK